MKYSESHEWVEVNGKIATIGITNYAQEQLGDVVYVELPKVGHTVALGDEVAVLESTKAAVDYYSPISGKIIDINIDLKEHPELINTAAENKGWIFKLEIKDPLELKNLMDLPAYANYLIKSFGAK